MSEFPAGSGLGLGFTPGQPASPGCGPTLHTLLPDRRRSRSLPFPDNFRAGKSPSLGFLWELTADFMWIWVLPCLVPKASWSWVCCVICGQRVYSLRMGTMSSPLLHTAMGHGALLISVPRGSRDMHSANSQRAFGPAFSPYPRTAAQQSILCPPLAAPAGCLSLQTNASPFSDPPHYSSLD